MTWRRGDDDADGGWCRTPYRHERQGEDAARFGRSLTWSEERELKHEATLNRQGCGAAFLRGYEGELRRQDEEREEQERREQREARERREARELELEDDWCDDFPSHMDEDDEGADT